MKTTEEEAQEKAERQVRMREAQTWTWEEIAALMHAPIRTFEMEQ